MYISLKWWTIIILLVSLFAVSGYVETIVFAGIENFYNIDSIYLDKLLTYSTIERNDNNFMLALARRMFFLPIYLYIGQDVTLQKTIYPKLLNLVLFGFCLFIILGSVSQEMAIRICTYYTIYEFIIMAITMSIFKNSIAKIAFFMCLIIFYGMRYYTSINNFYELYVPYNWIFSVYF